MADTLDWTVDDVEGCLTYFAQLRDSRRRDNNTEELERTWESRALLADQLDGLARVMTPAVHGLLRGFEVGRDPDELDSLISELLDQPTNSAIPAQMYSPLPPARANQSPGLLLWSYDSASSSRVEFDDDYRMLDISSSTQQNDGSSPIILAAQSSGGPIPQPRRKPGYAAAPISAVTCNLCDKRFECRSKVGPMFMKHALPTLPISAAEAARRGPQPREAALLPAVPQSILAARVDVCASGLGARSASGHGGDQA